MIAVIDASAALKWQFKDEEATGPATVLLEDFAEGKIELISPTLFTYEIVGAVNVAIERRWVSEEDGYKALANITSVGINLKVFDDLVEPTFRLARRFRLSPYDCAYMALADKEECSLLTGDKKLFNACRTRFPRVEWIGDYSGPPARN
jgi:predicted nucleic acid-binding protein